MTGREYRSEMKSFRDPGTDREIRQLTSGDSNNVHLYFTDNSFTTGDREIYFLSDRSSARPDVFNFFRMDLSDGRIMQITDEKNGIGSATKTPDSSILVYKAEGRLKKVDTRTGRTDVLYEEDPERPLCSPFISCDRKYVGMGLNQRISVSGVGPNYAGFKETMFAIKRSWITLVDMDGRKATDVWEDTHWLGHFQFSPNDPGVATFCHEGPWNLVHQRIWTIDFLSRSVQPCLVQGEDDCVGHEFWTRDGLIFFDNRRKGHDGTITSDRTQALVHEEESGQIPYVAFADKQGRILRTIDLPYYCNHYHANNDNTLLVGDAVDDLVLIDISGERPMHRALCTHGTSWYTGRTHCHPTFSWNGDRILYLSDKDGKCQLYAVDVEE